MVKQNKMATNGFISENIGSLAALYMFVKEDKPTHASAYKSCESMNQKVMQNFKRNMKLSILIFARLLKPRT